jgi:excisionase family DNA binding protein
MYDTTGRLALADLQRQRPQATRIPVSIPAYLRGLRELLTVKMAAKILARHPETIYRLIDHEGLPAEKHGRRWKIDPILLANWLEADAVGCESTIPGKANVALTGSSRVPYGTGVIGRGEGLQRG